MFLCAASFRDMELYEDDLRIKDRDFKHTVGNNSSRVDNHESDDTFAPLSIERKNDIITSRKKLPDFDAFIMPTELYISFDPDSLKTSNMLSRKDRLDFLSQGRHSTPASPEEMERTKTKQARDLSSSFHSPIMDKKVFSYSCFRTSKSEDHLQKSSLTTVNIDIEDEMASSLDTLLDTKEDFPDNLVVEDTVIPQPRINCEITDEKDVEVQLCASPPSEVSPSSSETSSPSKISVKYGELPPSRQLSERQHSSDSSGSEFIPSDSSSPTIRKDDQDGGKGSNSGTSEGECTSEQISAISSLEGSGADRSCATDSGSPTGSPEEDLHLDENVWLNDLEPPKEIRITSDSGLKPHEEVPKVSGRTSRNRNYPEGHHMHHHPRDTMNSVDDREKTGSVSSSLSATRPATDSDKKEGSREDTDSVSPTSPCSEDTFADVSYRELTESYEDDFSFTDFNEELPSTASATKNNNSSPTDSVTDDESDIESLHSFHYSPKAVDWPSASRLAKRLHALDGFKKTDVSRHLSKNNEFSRAVAEEYLRFFDFTGNGLDLSLRKFLSQFCLIGETQERERVLVHFSKRYLDCNPGSFRSQDAVHTLTCAIMLLNSDLHGENVCRKMVCGEFIENLAELNDGENFPRDVLKSLYYSIKTQPLEWGADSEVEKKSSKSSSNGPSVPEHRSSYIGHNPFLEVPNPNCATEYKKGYVMRKCCVDPSGKKTPLGKRGWKMLYATLKDLVLYLHKDEHGFKKNQLYDSLHNSIRIHHTFAEKAVDYTKKQYVFRLHTADQAIYLFQTSDSKELESWVDTINLVAASLSSPCLPPGVGNQRKFQRPLLPVSHTKLNLREQLQDHENRIMWLEREYEDTLNKTPEKGAKSRFLQEHAEKEAHLIYELNRYRTYAFLLRSRMAQFPELDTPLVQTTIGEVEEPAERLRGLNYLEDSPTIVRKTRSASIPMEANLTNIKQQQIIEDSNNSD